MSARRKPTCVPLPPNTAAYMCSVNTAALSQLLGEIRNDPAIASPRQSKVLVLKMHTDVIWLVGLRMNSNYFKFFHPSFLCFKCVA